MSIVVAFLGYSAATVGSFLMLPQIVKTWRSRKADELSIAMLAMYLVNCVLWLGYGVLVGSGPVVVANAIGLALGGVLTGFKLRYS